jgi:hypothetical protein
MAMTSLSAYATRAAASLPSIMTSDVFSICGLTVNDAGASARIVMKKTIAAAQPSTDDTRHAPR